jgi:hypothetical protein
MFLIPSKPGIRFRNAVIITINGDDSDSMAVSLRLMKNSLDVVSIGIKDKSTIVIFMVLKPQSRFAVIAPSGFHCGVIERLYFGTPLCGETDVDMINSVSWRASADPKSGFVYSKPGRFSVFGALQQLDSEWRKHRLIESLASLHVANVKPNMIKHKILLWIQFFEFV